MTVNSANFYSPAFKARVKVNITGEYFQKMKDSEHAEIETRNLLKGIRYLKAVAPSIAARNDDLHLYNKNGDLFLKLNNNMPSRLNNPNISGGMRDKLIEIQTDFMEKSFWKIPSEQSLAISNLVEIYDEIEPLKVAD
jgi:hypothetical protein